MNETPIRAYSKQELAQTYFPDIAPRSAVNRLRAWIDRCQPLSQALQGGGLPQDLQMVHAPRGPPHRPLPRRPVKLPRSACSASREKVYRHHADIKKNNSNNLYNNEQCFSQDIASSRPVLNKGCCKGNNK